MNSISPIDGRYKKITSPLSCYFSEFGFFKYRLYIEIQYFIHLIELLPELKLINNENVKINLLNIWRQFNESNYNTIKEYENVLQHDVKALEFFIRDEFKKIDLQDYISFIHFGLTSQDINTSANILSIKDAIFAQFIPIITDIKLFIENISKNMNHVMVAHTHGQPAVPTTMGKELYVFAYRLEEQLEAIMKIPFTTKFGGAVGNFNAHYAAYPNINWNKFADIFINNLVLKREKFTTQISNYDHLCNLLNIIKTINNIINDLNIDCWLYISKGYLKLKTVSTEVGSSTMPQKVNPINFENSEGNILLANSLIEGITRKLSVSRLQRDLTDSTILRNIGSLFAYSFISYKSTLKGLNKIDINATLLKSVLEKNKVIIAEGIQTILRKHNIQDAYEQLHKLTRNSTYTDDKLNDFIMTLPPTIQNEIKLLNINNYIGSANSFLNNL